MTADADLMAALVDFRAAMRGAVGALIDAVRTGQPADELDAMADALADAQVAHLLTIARAVALGTAPTAGPGH